MKKNLLLRLCLILMVAITAYSCRTDQFPEKEAYDNSSAFQLTAKTISLEQSKDKEKLLPVISNAGSDLKKVTGLGFGDGITVDTGHVVYIENGPDYHTYTFRVIRENAPVNAPLENLVLSPLTDGTYRKLLFTYHLTPQEKQTLIDGGDVDTKGKITITDLGGNFSLPSGGSINKYTNCQWVQVTTYTICNGSEGHHKGETTGCNGTVKSVKITTSIFLCDPDAGEGNPGGPELENPTPPTGGGCSPNGVLTGPQAPNDGMGMIPCGGGIPTLPNLPEPIDDLTPCDVLKENEQNQTLVNKREELKTLVTQATPDKDETLVVATKESDGTITYNTYVKNTSSGGLTIVSGVGTNKDIADIHNHPPGHIPIYSYDDIVNIYDSYKFLLPSRKTVFISYLVNFNGTTYALKMNDTSALDALFAGMNIGTATTTPEQRKLARDKVEAIFRIHGQDDTKVYNQTDAEKLFMDVINDSLVGEGNGVHIYRKDNDGWGKLNRDSNGNITKENCPV